VVMLSEPIIHGPPMLAKYATSNTYWNPNEVNPPRVMAEAFSITEILRPLLILRLSRLNCIRFASAMLGF
jgi:hypothetical protein